MSVDGLIARLGEAGVEIQPWQRKILELCCDPHSRVNVSVTIRHRYRVADPVLSRMLGDPRESFIEDVVVRGDEPHAVFVDEM